MSGAATGKPADRRSAVGEAEPAAVAIPVAIIDDGTRCFACSAGHPRRGVRDPPPGLSLLAGSGAAREGCDTAAPGRAGARGGRELRPPDPRQERRRRRLLSAELADREAADANLGGEHRSGARVLAGCEALARRGDEQRVEALAAE